MKALIFHSKEKGLQLVETTRPVPGKGEVVVELKYAALNHLDLWILKGKDLDKPVIMGSDGSGVVSAAAEDVDQDWLGREVIINPGLYWGKDENVQDNDFQILGEPTNGTFAEFIVIPVEYVFEKPQHLTLKETAALPMAALTAYRALFTKARITASDRVLITGIGGGAALFLMQMAVTTGAQVFVTSSSNEKIKNAMKLGARGGFNYKADGWVEKLKNDGPGFDVIIDSAGGDGFNSLLELANPAARIVLFGRTAGNINGLNPSVIFNKQLHIMGSLMGTASEFKSMLELYTKYELRPVIDSEFHLKDFSNAFEYMRTGDHFGKIILKID